MRNVLLIIISFPTRRIVMPADAAPRGRCRRPSKGPRRCALAHAATASTAVSTTLVGIVGLMRTAHHREMSGRIAGGTHCAPTNLSDRPSRQPAARLKPRLQTWRLPANLPMRNPRHRCPTERIYVFRLTGHGAVASPTARPSRAPGRRSTRNPSTAIGSTGCATLFTRNKTSTCS